MLRIHHVTLFATLAGCAHTSNPPNSRSCDDDTECPVGRRCSTGQCVSGDTVIAKQVTPSADPSSMNRAPRASIEAELPVQESPAPTTKSFSGIVMFGPINVPVSWTVKVSTLEDPAHTSVQERIREVKDQLKESTVGRRQKLLDELMSLSGQSRLRLRELGENEASLVEALMTLAEVWKYPEFIKRPPKNSGLVAAFPGTESGGTIYCDNIANVADDGSPGVDPALLKLESHCETKELQAFMLVEAIAEKGSIDSSHKCVALAEAGGGSYDLLLHCLKKNQR